MCQPKEDGGMGFRNLKDFNKALVAKQVWRMLQNPGSLVARVAKYFKHGDILTAPVNSNALYVWRSLAWSREVIKKGMIWRVGNGKQIKVFQDPWVNTLNSEKLNGREEHDLENLTLDTCMLQSSEWDVPKLAEILWPFELEVVQRTPIGKHGPVDRIFWKFEPKGNFSVKTVYLAERGYYEQHDCRSAVDTKMWNKLVWSLSIPPKVRIFLWRAFSNLLPSSANLRVHHVPTDGICSLCHDRWGTTEHSLLFYPLLREPWKSSRFWPLLANARYLKLWDIALMIFHENCKEDYEIWALMLWKSWSFFCDRVHGDDTGKALSFEPVVVALWESYQAAKPTFTSEMLMGVKVGEKKWRQPRNGLFRVDVDALFDSAANKFGVGVIIRDSKGEIKVAVSKPMVPSSNVIFAELVAVIQGLAVSIEHDLLPIEIHTDSLLAARVMANPDEEKFLLPEDMVEMLQFSRECILVGVSHVFRSANKAAHCLAQFSRCLSQPKVWECDFPGWLDAIVTDDYS